MSLRRRLLNTALRTFEKRNIAREPDPLALRRGFERKARLLFPPPRGSRFDATSLGGIPGLRVLGPGVEDDGTSPAILYIHGGAFVMGSPETHKGMLAALSARAGLPVLMPRYRLAPEHPFPAAQEDVRAFWDAAAARPLILGGDSAGGNLALGLLSALTAEKAALPLVSFAFSPILDMGEPGGSRAANREVEAVLPVERLAELRELYLVETDVSDPRASPIHADFHGAGPVWLTAGDTEILLDDTRRMAAHLRGQGVTVTEVIEHDLPHVWPLFFRWLPEARGTLDALAAWIRQQLPRPGES